MLIEKNNNNLILKKRLSESFFLEKTKTSMILNKKNSVNQETSFPSGAIQRIQRFQSQPSKSIYGPIGSSEIENTGSQLSQLFRKKRHILGLKKKPYVSYIESVLQKQTNSNIFLRCYSIQDSLKNASSIGFLIAKKLESKMRFPKIKRELFDQIQHANFIEGIRISCSGSLKGGLMAKTYTYKFGATSLQVFSKKIDYHFCHAITKYGCLGIKVWVAYR